MRLNVIAIISKFGFIFFVSILNSQGREIFIDGDIKKPGCYLADSSSIYDFVKDKCRFANSIEVENTDKTKIIKNVNEKDYIIILVFKNLSRVYLTIQEAKTIKTDEFIKKNPNLEIISIHLKGSVRGISSYKILTFE
jgi:hypothetical protein